MNLPGSKLLNRDFPARFLRIFWPPILIFGLHFVFARFLNFYLLFPWIDIPMHFLGGLSIAFSISMTLDTLQEERLIAPLDRVIAYLLIFSLVATIAVFWEFSEFSMDQLFGTNSQISLQNTMQDLFMGILGASTLLGYKIARKD